MNKSFTAFLWVALLGLAGIGTACAAQTPVAAPVSTLAPQAETHTDPFAYCSAVGTVDRPDARYVGQALPDALMQGYLQANNLDPKTGADENFKKMTIWRCMDRQVYVCNFGANLPCDSKAETTKIPTQAMSDFCKENPGSDFIPMAVTGHATIYSWHCVKDQPEVLDQISQVDAAGYLANIWYLVKANP